MADFVVSRLITELVVVDKMAQPIQTARSNVKAFGDEIAGAIGKGLGIAIGIDLWRTWATVIGDVKAQITSLIPDVMKFGDETYKLSAITGLENEQASELITVFGRFGVSSDRLATGLAFLGKNLQQVANAEADGRSGSVNFTDAMRNLNVEILDANGNARKHFDVLMDLADAFHAGIPAAEADQAAVASFFRFLGKEMIPILSLGSDGIKALMKDAKDMGYYLSTENVLQVRAAMLAQKELEVAISGARTQIALYFIPSVERGSIVLETLAQNLNKNITGFDSAGKAVTNINTPLDNLVGKLVGAANRFDALTTSIFQWRTMLDLASGPFGSMDLGQRIIDNLNAADKKTSEWFAHYIETMNAAVKKAEAAAIIPTGGNGPAPFDPEKYKAFNDELAKLTAERVKTEADAARQINQIMVDMYAKWTEDYRKELETLGEQNRKEIQAEDNTAHQIEQTRTTLYNLIAEKRYKLAQEIQSAIDQELAAEDAVATRMRSITFSKTEDAIKFAQDYAKIAQSMNDQITEANYQLGLKMEAGQDDQSKADAKYQDERVKAQETADKTIEDAQKRHNDAMALLMMEYNDIGSEGTVDNLKARYALLVKMRDEQRKGTQQVDDAKASAQQTLATKLDEIAKTEAADKAARDKKLADEQVATQHSIDLIKHKAEEERVNLADSMAATKRRVDFDISEEDRKIVAARADLAAKIGLDNEAFAHEVGLAKAAADQQIADELRVAKQRYDDYAAARAISIADYDAAITGPTGSIARANQQIIDLDRVRDEHKATIAQQVQDLKDKNPEYVAELAKRTAELQKQKDLLIAINEQFAKAHTERILPGDPRYDAIPGGPGGVAGPQLPTGVHYSRSEGVTVIIQGDVVSDSGNWDAFAKVLENAGVAATLGGIIGRTGALP